MQQHKAKSSKRRSAELETANPQLLKEIFTRNAYIRVPNEALRKELGEKYKKGYEVRFVAKTENEIEALRRLLVEAGFSPAKPFRKAQQIILPVYGKQAVAWFQHFREQSED